MKGNLSALAGTLFFSALALLGLSAVCWGGPPPPPMAQSIPMTPVGSAEVSAVTVAAVAAYGFWKMRK